MFLSNVRTALIVAINIPLALLFAFSMLYLRGKSANLLSIGAVDFGIIVDSSVIMVENIYRHLSAGENPDLRIGERICRASREIDKALFFSTAIMVCAFLPLFTMRGPEGQLFGPMADTYAFALGGALLLALTLAPVLCCDLFQEPQAEPRQFPGPLLPIALPAPAGSVPEIPLGDAGHHGLPDCRHGLPAAVLGPGVHAGAGGGQPVDHAPPSRSTSRWSGWPQNIDQARAIMASYPEVEVLVPAIGRPDDGTDPAGYYQVEIFAPAQAAQGVARPDRRKRLEALVVRGPAHVNKEELVIQMNRELRDKLPGVDWNFSQYIRDNVIEAMSGVKGDNSVKIFGPDLNKLEELADAGQEHPEASAAHPGSRHLSHQGRSPTSSSASIPDKCKRWGVSAADVNNLIQAAVGGKALDDDDRR